MKVRVLPVEPRQDGHKVLVAHNTDQVVGRLRMDTSGRWVIRDELLGKEVDYSELGFRNAVWLARRYFESAYGGQDERTNL